MAILTDTTNGLTKTFTGKDITDAAGAVIGSDITVNEHLWSMVANTAATAIATSMYTRKRVAQGKAPVASILF